MKKCPYCAEEIQDEAILCRYCKSDLTVPPPSSSPSSSSSSASSSAVSPSPAVSASSPTGTGAPAAADEARGSESVASDINDAFSSGPSAGAAVGGAVGGAAEPADPAGEAPGAASVYTHSGHRYVLGYGPDFFGIWDRQAPAAAVERFARTDDGWREAWQRYAALEPSNVEVARAGNYAGTGQAMQYTHSGQRFLLGYGADFFGIWDRGNLAQPVQRYPRTDEGWRTAWQQFATWEPHSSEVGIGGDG